MQVERIDAAVNWGNGKIYLFSGDSYWRWDISNDHLDSGYPKLTQDAWTGIWADGTTGVLYPGGNEAYFFKNDIYRIFDLKANQSDGVDHPVSNFNALHVPVGLLTPARELSQDIAAKICVWYANNGTCSFKKAWMIIRMAPDGTIASISATKPITIEPRSIGGVEYISEANKVSPFIDNLDPRMLVVLERLGRWLNADAPNVTSVMHLGIGHGIGAPNDCHNQGRALDLSGIHGNLDGSDFDLSIVRDWNGSPEKAMGQYRLDASSNPLAYDLFKRAYVFGTYECECKPGNNWPPTNIGEGGMVICPDYWGAGGVDERNLRKAHNNHIHMQIGPTFGP